jgi:hypothetical protein
MKNPVREFDRMVEIMGLAKRPVESSIVKPSQQASAEMGNESVCDRQLTRWMKRLDREQLDEINVDSEFFQCYNI